MTREGGVRQHASGASLRLHALSVCTDDQFRSTLSRKARAKGCSRMCLGSVHPSWQTSLSPFVPKLDDSESVHADPSGTPLALPDRLAAALGRDPVRAGEKLLRGVWAATRAEGLLSLGWPLVGP